MDRAVLRSGSPVRNLQHLLRRISYHYNTVSAVVPDGIFSDQTHQSVISFQETFNLDTTGIVDKETWDTIVVVYDGIVKKYSPPRTMRLIPHAESKIHPGEENDVLFAIQALMLVISKKFENVPTLEVCGVHDEASVNTIKKIQEISNLPCNGIIDKMTYDMIAAIYEMFILAPDYELQCELPQMEKIAF